MILVLSAHNRIHVDLDDGEARGLAHEAMELFETFANERLASPIGVVFVQKPRDRLVARLLAGRGEVAVANLAVTPQRSAPMVFTAPLREDAAEQARFTLVADNAGPGNIARAREPAAACGRDPNRWFDHVEVATAEIVSAEPRRYVRNLGKYDVPYRRLLDTAAGA
ncbi:MAG: hypothetical protein ACLFU0_08245 [Alphaproteobacteria bacterium]